jgi:hypothetical protein
LSCFQNYKNASFPLFLRTNFAFSVFFSEKTRFMEFLTNTKELGQFSLRKRYSQFLSQKRFFLSFLFVAEIHLWQKAKKAKDVPKLCHNVSCFFGFAFNPFCVAILKLTNNICLDNIIMELN